MIGKKGILMPFRFGNRMRFKLLDVHNMIERGFRAIQPKKVHPKVYIIKTTRLIV